MKSKDRQLMIEAMPVRLGEGHTEFSVGIREPGEILSVAWTLEKRLVMTSGNAQFDEVLAMFLEFEPNGPIRNRRFMVLATGQGVNVPSGVDAVFVGTASSSNTGRIAHIYELIKVDA